MADSVESMTDHARRVWRRIAVAALIATSAFFIIGEVVLHNAGPILKGRIIETLSTRFDSRVELDNLDVSIGRGLEVSGQGLRIFPPDEIVAAGVKQPLIAVRNFHFHSGVHGLFLKPMHVAAVSVTGLDINIPPREVREQAPQRSGKHKGKIKIVVEQILCEDSRLVIGTNKPDKDPKIFVLRHIELHEVGPKAPWRYNAILTNAIPRGEIQSRGAFGPWQTESPGDSYVDGHYVFSHADLNTIKGIGGILSSVGDFKGRLDRIEVHGKTQTPDFSLDTANHGVPLTTEFTAIVDGTSGDTYLQPVNAKLGDSRFSVRGAVISVKGKGHRVQLDTDIPAGQIADFLNLAVKTQPPVLTAIIQTKTQIIIEPGTQSVIQKLKSQGSFTLRQIHFTNSAVQDKVDMLSLRARGEPKKAKPGAADVSSLMQGSFSIGGGRIVFDRLDYSLPGAEVNLAGVYSMDGQQFDFKGEVMTKATLRQMVASWWKSWLLAPVSPFFKKDGAGAVIPVTISGTRSEPKFGLDLFHHSDNDKSRDTGQK